MASADTVRKRSVWRSAMQAAELYRLMNFGSAFRRGLTLPATALLLAGSMVSAKPSDHSYSLIKIYTPRTGSDERTRILSVAMRGDIANRDRRAKVLALRVATLMDPQIWETDDWRIAFLSYRYPAYDSEAAPIGYGIVTAGETGEWTLRWSMDDSGTSRSCDELFDHLVEARKFIAHRGLDPKKFAPELLPLERAAELTMREYKGVCEGDF